MLMAPQDSSSLRILFLLPFSPRRDAMHGGRVAAQLIMRLATRHQVAVGCLRQPGSLPIEPSVADRCDVVEEI